MIVLDAFAVLALLKDEPAAPQVRLLIGEAHLTSNGLGEVVDQLVRVLGHDVEAVLLDLAELGLLEALSTEAMDGVRAGLLRAAHYHRATRAVSLVDCTVAEAARSREERIATADPHLLDLCHDEGIPVIALPDSHGRRWPSTS